MKRILCLVLVFVLTVCLFAGCRRGSSETSPMASGSEPVATGSEDGSATDGDGKLGEDNAPSNARRSGKIYR